MDFIVTLIAVGSLLAAIIGAICFGTYLEKKQLIENMAVLTIAMLAMGVFIYWLLVTQASKVIEALLG